MIRIVTFVIRCTSNSTHRTLDGTETFSPAGVLHMQPVCVIPLDPRDGAAPDGGVWLRSAAEALVCAAAALQSERSVAVTVRRFHRAERMMSGTAESRQHRDGAQRNICVSSSVLLCLTSRPSRFFLLSPWMTTVRWRRKTMDW